jgi:hypothetical protein
MSSEQLNLNIIQNDTPVKNNNKQTKKRKISTIATTVADNNTTTIITTPSNSITAIVDANTIPTQLQIDSNNTDNSTKNNTSDNLNSLFESMKNETTDSTNTNTNTSKYVTIIDICKIYSIDSDQNNLVALTISNFYAGRHHIKDFIYKSSKLFYNPYVNQLCKDKTLIKDVADIKYLFHKNLRPVTMISSYPTTENKYFFETMEETLKKLIIQYDGKSDPENEGKTFCLITILTQKIKS